MAYPNRPLVDPAIARVGRAWALSLDSDQAAGNGIGADWLVEDNSEQRDPNFWWFLVTGSRLRDSDDGVFVPNATHEIIVLALDPDHALCDVEHWRGGQAIAPPAVFHQFLARTDRQAAMLVLRVVQHICNGHSLHQGEDYWVRFVDNLAEHAYYGCHPHLN